MRNVNQERHFINNIEAIADLFSAGVVFGVLTEEIAKPYLQAGKLIVLNQGKTLSFQLPLAWYKRPEPPAYFSELIKRCI